MAGPAPRAPRSDSRPPLRSAVRLLLPALLLVLVVAAPGAFAQDEHEEQGDRPSLTGVAAEAAEREPDQDDQGEAPETPLFIPFFTSFYNTPKAGLKASVRSTALYSQLSSELNMRRSAKLTNTADWEWEDFRQQEKISQKRNERFAYLSGQALPAYLSVTGSWDWSLDETENNAGLNNTSRRDFKLLDMELAKKKIEAGGFSTDLTATAGMKEQKAINQNIHNDFSEANAAGRIVSAYELADDVKVVGRAFGKKTGGDRSLGTLTSPSSAIEDSVGLKVVYDRRWMSGNVELIRNHYEEEFLDFNRSSLGLIDTSGTVAKKIVDEMKTRNALTMNLANRVRAGAYGLDTDLTYSTSELAYRANGLGRTERLDQAAHLAVYRASDRDSIAVTYGYGWKWDDQRIKDATENRGRQYAKDRTFDVYWQHLLFRATELTFKYQTSLTQSVAENRFNQNDRDRLREDMVFEISRRWKNGFFADVLMAYKSSEDLSIRSTRSSNNNIKDSYEVAPGYEWPVASWISLNQHFRVNIEYTDYIYSDLESVNKQDDYNKRGVLNTNVTFWPTDRLTVTVKHDYNQRFNATRTKTDATGNSYYHVDDRQRTSQIDLGLRLEVVPQKLTVEGATFSRLDEKERIGETVALTENQASQVWLGAKFDHTWGPKTKPRKFYVMVKKYYAYGPAVTETNADYWEADAWLNWKF